MNDRGSLVWRIIFGVVMAGLLIGIFLAYTATQREYAAGEKAQNLANDLSRTTFSALAKRQQTFDLPPAVGEADYELDIENNTFIVRVLDKDQKTREYRSGIDLDLEVRSLPGPGDTLYAQGRRDEVIISSSPIEPPQGELTIEPSPEPPDFYEFAKDDPRTAAGAIASYFHIRELHSGRDLDVKSYKWENEGTLLTRITSDGETVTGVRVTGHMDRDGVGLIRRAWIVTGLEDTEEKVEEKVEGSNMPSIREAHSTGWLYPPEEILTQLRERTWRRKDDDRILSPPDNLDWGAASVTTDVSTYPTWRLEFESEGSHYVLHFGALAWDPGENRPGFVFESDPDLEAVR